jgi:hypothetical protein
MLNGILTSHRRCPVEKVNLYILEMIREGKLSVAEAVDLLKSLEKLQPAVKCSRPLDGLSIELCFE